jgi:hypothetical protein
MEKRKLSAIGLKAPDTEHRRFPLKNPPHTALNSIAMSISPATEGSSGCTPTGRRQQNYTQEALALLTFVHTISYTASEAQMLR